MISDGRQWIWVALAMLLMAGAAAGEEGEGEATAAAAEPEVKAIFMGDGDDQITVLVLVVNRTNEPFTIVRKDLEPRRTWILDDDMAASGLFGTSRPEDPEALAAATMDPGQVFGAVIEVSRPDDFDVEAFEDGQQGYTILVQFRGRIEEKAFQEMRLRGPLRQIKR